MEKPHSILERSVLCFNSYKNCKSNVKLWKEIVPMKFFKHLSFISRRFQPQFIPKTSSYIKKINAIKLSKSTP